MAKSFPQCATQQLAQPSRQFLNILNNDRIIDNQGVLDALAPLPEGRLRIHRFEEASHALQFDEVESLVDRIAEFIDATGVAP